MLSGARRFLPSDFNHEEPSMRYRAVFASFLAIIAFTSALTFCLEPTSAALVTDVGDASVAPGGATTVDVTISSTLAGGEPLAFFGFEFLISTAGPTQLDFVDPQSDSQLTDAN